MNKIQKVIQALTGYAGSSENPEKFSLRMMGIVTTVMSQFSPIISYIVVHSTNLCATQPVDQCLSAYTNMLEPIFMTVGCALWLIGAGKAVYKALQNSDTPVGAFLRR